MNTTHTRTKRLLVAGIGAAVVGISVAAAAAAAADPPSHTYTLPSSPPTLTYTLPPPPSHLTPPPLKPPYVLPTNKTGGGWLPPTIDPVVPSDGRGRRTWEIPAPSRPRGQGRVDLELLSAI